MKEILPGILHWTNVHPKIQIEVSSYYLVDEAVLIDPLTPPEGLDRIVPPPKNILLTNRHHYRHSGSLQEKYGANVWCVESGLHEFQAGETVKGFRFGDTLPGEIQALEVGVLCPDETALLLGREGGVLAVADGVVRYGDGPLRFVPDEYIGDNPEEIKTGLKAAYERLLERTFDHLLLAHGAPWIGGAHTALREFVES
jgi:hypothetical protein